MTPTPQRPLIHNLEITALKNACAALSLPPYRAKQIWNWLYVKRAASAAAMTNLPAATREALEAAFDFSPCSVVEDGGLKDRCETAKLLLELRDGERVEQVVIPAEGRITVCVSTQAGCKYGCAFCASGMSGFKRNLETGEITGQVLAAANAAGRVPTHVVFMGIGEPLDNYENVLAAARILNDPDGMKIGARRMTISTCGLAPAIRRLAGEGMQIELSVSLHAPDDELRSRLMPINRRHPIAELLDACRRYTAATGRIITFEYTLIKDVNDSIAQAKSLRKLLSGFPCRVNLIPLSPVAEFDGAASLMNTARRFQKTLASAGINTTLRHSRGAGVNAACGQLRRSAKTF